MYFYFQLIYKSVKKLTLFCFKTSILEVSDFFLLSICTDIANNALSLCLSLYLFK